MAGDDDEIDVMQKKKDERSKKLSIGYSDISSLQDVAVMLKNYAHKKINGIAIYVDRSTIEN